MEAIRLDVFTNVSHDTHNDERSYD